MSNQGKDIGFPLGKPKPKISTDVAHRRISEGETIPWLKSLRSKRAFDAIKAMPSIRTTIQPEQPAVLERTPTFAKATSLELPEHCTGEDALVATVDNCLTHLSANEDCALAGIDPEGVHQMRVALRRLDASLTLYKPLIPETQMDRLQRRIKSVTQTLGPARDWDVFIGDMLDPVASNMSNDPDLKFLRNIALRQRMAAYREVQKTLRSQPYREMWQEVALWLAEREWRQQPVSEKSVQLMHDVRAFSESVLDEAHRKLLKRGKGFAVLDARERHKLRIRIKKVRYAAEFFSPLYHVERSESFLVALRNMQDDLGRLNDVETARGLVDGLTTGDSERARRAARAGGLVIGWHRHAAAQRENQLVRHWRKLKKAEPFWH
jgi:CHAD domain-containing protein